MSVASVYATFPEIFLAVAAMLLLIAGAFCKERWQPLIGVFSIVSLLATGILILKLSIIVTPFFHGDTKGPVSILHCVGCTAFNHMFLNDRFTNFVKFILLIASILSLLMSFGWLKNTHTDKPEYPVLILFATLGMMLMVSANDFLALYVGLELQSLVLYVLAAFQRDNAKSSEAGLKYFVLGALSSGLILYGISLIYGFAGTTSFEALPQAFGATPSLGVIFGLVFICAALAFKVSAVPFHMWTPDVYEGAPTPVTAFFAAAPKVAALALFARVLLIPFAGLMHQWLQIVIFIAVASMILGSFAGLVQSNTKRLLAYSSIANVGFALVGLAVGNDQGIQALLIYLAIYFLNTIGTFAVMAGLRRQGVPLENLTDFAGLAKTKPLYALAMVIFMFSLAGVPPLAGFFGKYFIFLAAVKANMVPLAIIGVLSSVVSAYYYLRIIKLMYFDEPSAPLDSVADRPLQAVIAATALTMLLFVLYPAPLVDHALVAAQSLTDFATVQSLFGG